MLSITIMDYLAAHVKSQPDNLALVCIDKRTESKWTYRELFKEVQHVASHLKDYGTQGDRALLLMDTGIDYVTSFLACQYLGITAIPSFPPESAKQQHIDRTIGIAKDAQATLVLTSSKFNGTVEALCEHLPNTNLLAIDKLEKTNTSVAPYSAKKSDIAFLQYTSGSTARPKGVMVSHGNLIANEKVITERMATGKNDVMVSWLPLFHDMGLIGGLLQPLFVGYPLVLTSPRYFMERPLRWLQLLSKYKGTISGGPDFSYRLCIERVKATQLAELNLSNWRVAYSGAEPIRHDTLLDFADKFSLCGFNKAALYPCYGLAEGTLMVTGSRPFTGAHIRAFDNVQLAEGTAQQVESHDLRNTDSYSHQVGCGSVGSDHYLRITCPDSFDELPSGQIGEIWTSGESIALGYWRNDQATQEAFVEHAGKRWLRTGDVGYLCDEQLYISGRQKDLIIMNGHNVYPQDIERAIETHLSFVRKGRVSAFPVPSDDSGEGIGLAIETANTYRNEVAAEHTAQIIRDFVISHFSVSPELVLLLQQGTLPKTSSGKLQRSVCLKLHYASKLASYGVFDKEALQHLSVQSHCIPEHWQTFEIELAKLWQNVLNYPITNDDADFFALGGSSIKASQLIAKVQDVFACQLNSTSVFVAHTFKAFCEQVRAAQGKAQDEEQVVQLQQKAYPLSAQQMRQLFLWQLQPNSSAYHIGAEFHFTGTVEAKKLQLACAYAIKKHSIFSQAYIKNADQAVLQVTQDNPLNWLDIDLSKQAKPLSAAQAWLKEFTHKPFALEQGDNARFALLKLGANSFILSQVFHHIATDAWSFELITKDIAHSYQRLVAGETLPTLEKGLNYGDYAQWQQTWLKSEQANEQLSYWKKQLSGTGDEELLSSPVDRHQLDPEYSPLGVSTLHLGYKQVEQLQAFAHSHGASLYMLLLASLQVLFYRFSGKQKPRIGVPVANRRSSALQDMAGFFVNTQVICSELAPQQNFVEVLKSVKNTALEAQIHQDYPFEKLVETLNPSRQVGQNPLFQLMFNHVEYDLNAWSLVDNIQLNEITPIRHEAQFDLSIDSRLFKDGNLELELQFNQALFEPSLIQQLKDAWHSVLLQSLNTPKQPIGNLALLKDPQQLLEQGQGESLNQANYQWLGQLSDRASSQADQTAIIYQDEHYSYAWLEQRANQFAHGLLAQNSASGNVIGLMLSRSPNMLAATLGCLKAGLVYLPLDKNFPADKLDHMLLDSGCQLVLTEDNLSHLNWQGKSLSLESLASEFVNQVQAPKVSIAPEQVAYLNYTSGSTGQAKGIAVSYIALAKYIESAIEFIQLKADDVVLQFSTANFDGFVEQVFPTWAVGGAILLRDDTIWSPDELFEHAQRHQVSVMDLSAAYWKTVAASWAKRAKAKGPLQLENLRQVHSGGEVMSVQGVKDWQAAGLVNVRLLNTYGPTEIVVEAAIYECQKAASLEAIPLGKALMGRKLYVLDDNLELVLPGQVGQLFVGGDILAREYWQKPQHTAIAFVADPFCDNGERMYATGDLVRWHNGCLEYVGRGDHQVKIRGFRVELGEVEQKLAALDEVAQAVVITQARNETLNLIAYVELEAGKQNITQIALKHKLAQLLPHYMVPSHIEILAHLPVNASGKLERHQLPAITQQALRNQVIGQTPIEHKLSELWQHHLNLDTVDVHSNFFDLGGHSLILMSIFEELQSTYPKLKMTDLFAYPSVASLAQFITSLAGNSAVKAAVNKEIDSVKQKRSMNAFAAKKRKNRES